MGCKASKAAAPVTEAPPKVPSNPSNISKSSSRASRSSKKKVLEEDHIYNLLARAHTEAEGDSDTDVTALTLSEVMEAVTPKLASYKNPSTQSTPLHMAVRLLDNPSQQNIPQLLVKLLEAYPNAIFAKDSSNNIPLHYAIGPEKPGLDPSAWLHRLAVFQLLVRADRTSFTRDYLQRNDIVYEADSTTTCSALYRALETVPDDFDPTGPTVQFLQAVVAASGEALLGSNDDQPLALLYRRFTRQFDLAEKFFSGDNSRPQVVQHRQQYKTAAANTWKIIECLLRQNYSAAAMHTVHRAVQVETPPDLLRYIVETNAEDLATPDDVGKLPLHYAASMQLDTYPAFYSKYVMDELLYKYPEAASKQDGEGNFPITLAVQAGKLWIGGGIKSLHEAYPEGLEQQVDLEEHHALKEALSLDLESQATNQKDEEDEKASKPDIIRDEHHDAIMLVQKRDATVAEVVTSLWAHEEDAGVQMLGCVALGRMVKEANEDVDLVMRIALSAVPAVVNAMKAHPNEVIVQEKACHVLAGMADCDGQREISFVASGAVAAIVGAMQAHVSDPGVQEEACAAIARIIHAGGDDRATIVASVSGLTAIVNAISAHPTVVGVQLQGCRALQELTEFPQANLPELPQAQVEPLLQAAKTKFPDECAETANLVLSRLS